MMNMREGRHALKEAGKNDAQRPTVLVVDDYDDTRRIVRWMLEQKGYCIVEAANGREAVEVAAQELPNVILMDLAMPEVDGFGALRLVREHTELAETPIIAVTAYDMAEAREKAEITGFAHYLTKPIDFQRLSVLIDRILTEQKSARAADALKEKRQEKRLA